MELSHFCGNDIIAMCNLCMSGCVKHKKQQVLENGGFRKWNY